MQGTSGKKISQRSVIWLPLCVISLKILNKERHNYHERTKFSRPMGWDLFFPSCSKQLSKKENLRQRCSNTIATIHFKTTTSGKQQYTRSVRKMFDFKVSVSVIIAKICLPLSLKYWWDAFEHEERIAPTTPTISESAASCWAAILHVVGGFVPPSLIMPVIERSLTC